MDGLCAEQSTSGALRISPCPVPVYMQSVSEPSRQRTSRCVLTAGESVREARESEGKVGHAKGTTNLVGPWEYWRGYRVMYPGSRPGLTSPPFACLRSPLTSSSDGLQPAINPSRTARATLRDCRRCYGAPVAPARPTLPLPVTIPPATVYALSFLSCEYPSYSVPLWLLGLAYALSWPIASTVLVRWSIFTNLRRARSSCLRWSSTSSRAAST